MTAVRVGLHEICKKERVCVCVSVYLCVCVCVEGRGGCQVLYDRLVPLLVSYSVGV